MTWGRTAPSKQEVRAGRSIATFTSPQLCPLGPHEDTGGSGRGRETGPAQPVSSPSPHTGLSLPRPSRTANLAWSRALMVLGFQPKEGWPWSRS